MTLTLIGAKPLSLNILEWLLKLEDIKVVSVLTIPEEESLLGLASASGLESATDFNRLKKIGDFGLIVGYPRILAEAFILRFKKIFNVHFGILPFYRGSSALSFAMIQGEEEFGVTFHLVDKGIDTGPIYDIRKFPLPTNLSAEVIVKMAEETAIESIYKNLIPAMKGQITPVPQTSRFPLYSRAKLEKLLPLNRNESKEVIKRKVRALTLPNRPAPYFLSDDGKQIEVAYGDYE